MNLRPFQSSSIQECRNLLARGVKRVVWVDIDGCKGIYQVSNTGLVRSIDRVDSMGRKREGRILSPGLAGAGYQFVCLTVDGKRFQRYVHRLVADAFLDGKKEYVNHKNGIKTDNRVENLEWVTPTENMVHSTYVLGNPLPPANGRLRNIAPVIGVHVKTGEVVEYASQAEAQRNGFHQQQISDCLRGYQKTHRGFSWRYAS